MIPENNGARVQESNHPVNDSNKRVLPEPIHIENLEKGAWELTHSGESPKPSRRTLAAFERLALPVSSATTHTYSMGAILPPLACLQGSLSLIHPELSRVGELLLQAITNVTQHLSQLTDWYTLSRATISSPCETESLTHVLRRFSCRAHILMINQEYSNNPLALAMH
ncbi:hypothetical protein Tco_0111303 [Tanacetum coccineum]